MAVEQGFFKEEGLDVSLVKYSDWSTYKDALALGGFDITHHLIMMFLKPIEQGMDVKILAGVHRGCLRVQTSTTGGVQNLEDLRGKRIGVPGMGSPPFIFANRALALKGIGSSKANHLEGLPGRRVEAGIGAGATWTRWRTRSRSARFFSPAAR